MRRATTPLVQADRPEPVPAEREGPLAVLLSTLGDELGQDDPLNAILRRDAREVEHCLGAASKAVLMLCGSILEGVLVHVLSARHDLAQPAFDRSGRSRFPNDASLHDLLDLATRKLHENLEPLLGQEYPAQVKTVIDHRDLIHPHSEVRGGRFQVDEHTARLLYDQVCVVVRDVARAVKAGWLEKYRNI